MARSANQKLKLLLLRQYLERNSDEEHPVSTAQLLEYLASEGISAERKSIYSDMEALQSFGLDLIRVRDGNSSGWYIGERVFQLPELRLLADSVHLFTEREPAEDIVTYAPYLDHIHLCEAGRALPEGGISEGLAEILAAMRRIGYDKTASFEPMPHGLEAMKNGLGGGTNAAGALGDLAGLGVSLGAMGSVIGMTKDALNPMTQDAAQMGAAVGAAVAGGWDCPVCVQNGKLW